MTRATGKTEEKRGPRLTAAEERRRLQAYRSTRRDVEAAQRLGLKIMTFRLWRIRRGLKARGVGYQRPGNQLSRKELARRRQVVLKARSVREAARELQLDVFHLYRFMRIHGLPTPRRSLEGRERHRPVGQDAVFLRRKNGTPAPDFQRAGV